jgi:hypothetical protein
MKTRITPRLMAEIAAILDDDDRSTPMPGRPDLDDWTEGRFPHKQTSQSDIDALPRDRRERDGEAFDIPIRFGDGMRWDGHERQPRDRADIVGDVIGALIVVGVAAFIAWMAARGMGGIRWR